ncbi:MAG: TrmH family RNA methyltransferase [Terriglobales bacterium]
MAESINIKDRLRRVTSRQNALVKEVRRAFARGECTHDGYCAIESVRLIEEAIRSGLKFRAVLFSESAASKAARLLPQLGSHVETVVLPDDIFAGAVATESPQGVAALVKFKEHDLDAALRVPDALVVVVAGIQDPGNLGTIARSAEGFGAHAVLLGEGTVSLFNPKVVRASAGSVFRVNMTAVELNATIAKLRGCGLRLVATSSHRGTPLQEARLSGPLALFIGNEGAGLPREILKEVDETVMIPHSPKVESLNAGVAASILLYEIARQRQK